MFAYQKQDVQGLNVDIELFQSPTQPLFNSKKLGAGVGVEDQRRGGFDGSLI